MPDQPPTSAPDTARAADRKAKATVLVDLTLCKACGICISLCPADVFDTDEAGQAVPVRVDQCTVCRLCEWHCPDFAIEVFAERPNLDEDA